MVAVAQRHRVEDFFIAPTYRKGQREALLDVAAAFDVGYRYVILEAPTGSGKSHIGRAMAFYYEWSYILTVQKILQGQYQRDFPDVFVMKGRSAYDCVAGRDYPEYAGRSCADGVCKAVKGIIHEDCPYRLAIEQARNSNVVVYNFDSFYYQNLTMQGAGFRKLMVIDEAHNTENKFIEFFSFKISNRAYRDLIIPEYKSIGEYDDFLEEMRKKIRRDITDLELSGFAAASTGAIRLMDELRSLEWKIKKYFSLRESGMEFVFLWNQFGTITSIEFRPVFVGQLVEEYLLTKAEKFLLMSATILDRDVFCESVGIDPEEAKFIRVPSTFPPENRPIKFLFAGSMAMKNKADTLPRLIDRIVEVLAAHPTRRGIIHTHSEEIAKYIQANLDDARLTFRKDYDTVDDMLVVHGKKAGSIIVASGLREGLDLYDDLSNVQIICKVPYPSLIDKRIKRILEIRPEYYGWLTVFMFVQSLGRSVRNERDRAVTYVLDSDFERMYIRYKRFIPDYVKEVIEWA